MIEPLRILILEGRATDVDLVMRELRNAGLEFVAKAVATEREYLAELRNSAPQLILADYSLPGYDGLSALTAAQEHCPETPFIFVSGSLGEERAIETLQRGATDYVLKDRLARLGPAARRALREREETRKQERAQQEKTESEEQFRAMFEVVSIGLAQSDPRTRRWLRVNQKFCAIVGYSAAELLQMGAPDLTHPDDRQRDADAFQQTVRGEVPNYHLEKRLVRKDGTVAWVNVNMSILRDAAGQPVRTMAAIEDITDRKREEVAVQESRQLLHAVVEGISDAVYLKDLSGRYRLFNAAASRYVGKPADEVIGHDDTLIFPLQEAQVLMAGDRRVMAGGKTMTYEEHVTTPDGTARTFYATKGPIFDAKGKTVGLFGIARDITDRKQAEQALRQSEERYRTITKCIPDLVWVMDLSGRFTYANAAVERTHGWTVEEWVRLSLRDTVAPPQAIKHEATLREELAKANAPGYDRNRVLSFESEELHKNGSSFWAEISATFLWSEDGKPVGVIGVTRDITERKRVAEALRESQERFAKVFQEAPVWIAISELADGTYLDVNPEVLRVSGFTREEVIGRRALDLRWLTVADRDRLHAELQQHGRIRGLEMSFRAKDGRQLHGLVKGEQVSLGGRPCLLTATVDITERKQLEEALRESGQFSQQVVASVQEGIIVHGRDLRYQVWNPFMERLTGKSADQVLGKHPDEVFPFLRETGVLAAIEKTLVDEPSLTVDVPFHGFPSGKSGWISTTSSPLRNAAGEIIGVIEIVRDISMRKRAELRTAAFASLGQRLSTAKTAKEAGEIIVDVADALLGWDACVFNLYSAAENRMSHLLTIDIIDGRRTECQPRRPYPPPTGVNKRAIEEGGQLVLRDHPKTIRPEDVPFGDETRASASLMFVPVRHGKEVVGILSIQSYTPKAYNADSLETLQALADHGGGALERLRAQEALSGSEATFRSVWERSIDGMRLTDQEGYIIAVNEAFCRLVRLPREKLEGQIFSVAYLGHGADEGIEVYQKRFAAGDFAPRMTTRTQLWDGVKVNLEISNSFVELGPRRKLLLSILQDVSERKLAELRVEAFSKLGQRLSAAKTVREAAGIISEVADDLLGWDACLFSLYLPARDLLNNVLQMDTVNGRRVEFSLGYITPSVMARRAIEAGGQLILKEEPDEMAPGGRPFGDKMRASASIMYVPVRKGAEVIGVLSLQSYTPRAYDQRGLETLQALADHCGGAFDRLRMEEAWQTATQRLGHLLTQSPAVIYSLKTDGQKTEPAWVSDNIERLLGYTAAECQRPDSLFHRLHPQERQGVIDSLVRLQAEKQIARDYQVQHKNGENRWVRDEQRLVCDTAGAPVEIVGSWVDITERKALEEQLRQSQKMDAVGQLAGGVAHDFNNMLAVIRGNAELLLMDEVEHNADTREGLANVVTAAERAANLTRQLLAFSRKQVLQPQPLVLNEVIANLTKMLKRVIGENIDLQCHYTATLPCVQADTSMMEQVILNLVVNARDAMPEGGELHVATRPAVLDEAHARTNPEARAGEFVCLSVRDTGTGIAPEYLARIFEPFFTTKEVGKGTGLGLATVYGIVKQHAGWIEVSSQLGEGSTFRVFLPALPTPALQAAAAKAETEIRGGKETILLVEDDPAVRSTTRRVLESKGYTIQEATSAREALEVWHRHAGEIALLLTDIIMPDQMTGRDLAERLWGERPGLKVVFMSGYSADVLGQNTDFLRRTSSAFVQKPCSSRTLLETVRHCLDAKQAGDALGEAARVN
jgi:PAS domain S-box-containing protein